MNGQDFATSSAPGDLNQQLLYYPRNQSVITRAQAQKNPAYFNQHVFPDGVAIYTNGDWTRAIAYITPPVAWQPNESQPPNVGTWSYHDTPDYHAVYYNIGSNHSFSHLSPGDTAIAHTWVAVGSVQDLKAVIDAFWIQWGRP